ncbi:MAG: hypothetical protein II178_07240, partial [Selenomonadaceae bacterium]|nr:hypothetical protein [Selenomonadaceae bacterium]
ILRCFPCCLWLQDQWLLHASYNLPMFSFIFSILSLDIIVTLSFGTLNLPGRRLLALFPEVSMVSLMIA